MKNRLEDFWRYVEKDGPIPKHRPDLGCCWTWKGTIDKTKGYAIFNYGGDSFRANRIAYELAYGPIEPGKEIDHLCRNRACPRPSHLEAVTRKENILRGVSFSALNAARDYCPKGHPYSPENTYVSPKGDRRCRACARLHVRRDHWKHREKRLAHMKLKRLERKARGQAR